MQPNSPRAVFRKENAIVNGESTGHQGVEGFLNSNDEETESIQ